jgi:precorrin-6Y C5,15-methyltransferase (decarboxylating)
MTDEPLVIIGVGADGPTGLSADALSHIARARVLAGGKRLLDFFPGWAGERIVIDADLERVLDVLRGRYRQVKTVVLASGDPLFYGIGRVLLERFPREDLVFVPQVSSVQLAFARLKETWNDACVVSVHGRPRETLLPPLRRREHKIAVLTDAQNDPGAIAALLREHGLSAEYDLWVGEDLGTNAERIGLFSSHDEGRSFSPLNVVVLLRKPQTPPTEREPGRGVPLLGIPDHALVYRQSLPSRRVYPGGVDGGDEPDRSAGMLTRRDVRVLSVAYLQLHAGDVLWDIGAGSGSVSLEAARLDPALRVFAIEKDEAMLPYLKENVRSFALKNVAVVAGEAPEKLAGLPDPDRVFIGGNGGRLLDILAAVAGRLKAGGRIVANCITLETVAAAWGWFQGHGWQAEATSVQLAHSRRLGTLHSFEPENPVTIIRATRV